MLNDPLLNDDHGPVEFDLDFIEYRAAKLADMSPAYRTQLALVAEVRRLRGALEELRDGLEDMDAQTFRAQEAEAEACRLRAEVEWMRGVRPRREPDAGVPQ